MAMLTALTEEKMTYVYKLLALVAPLPLIVACAGLPAEKTESVPVVAQAQPQTVCYEDTPTGTRFSRVKCLTPEELQRHRKAGQEAADEMRQIRAMPQDMK